MDLPATEAIAGAASRSVDVDAFGRALAASAPRHRAVRQLHGLLSAIAPGTTLEERAEQLEQLMKWVRATGKVPPVPGADPADRPQVSRLRLVVAALETFPAYRLALAGVLRSILEESSGLMLLARLGLPIDRGFYAETIDRLSRRLLPEPTDPKDLAQLVARLFPAQRDAVWLSGTPLDLVERLVSLLADPAGSGLRTWDPIAAQTADAVALLATRISAVGLSDVIRLRSPEVPLAESPFFRLPRACDALLAAAQTGHGDVGALNDECVRLVHACRNVVSAVVDNLERFGVSIDVVFRVELIQKTLDRLEELLTLVVPPAAGVACSNARKLLVALIQARVKDRDLGEISKNNLHLMARKIIERAGQTGEHYITSTRGEYAKMLLSAGGGGILTAGTTALKYIIGWAHFAPFIEGMLSAANYAGSFLIMQFLGFTLATKQPSMTAAALAGSMRESAGYTDLGGLVTMIARITRSQLAAAIGNIGAVIPAAFALDYVHRQQFGRAFLDEDTAKYVLHSLHPTESGTIFCAALTGVLLWVSSVGAGWLENWAIYRHLPEAIAEHRIKRFIGSRVTVWASRVFARNISGIGGNTTLGVLLGLTPVMGKFFGLPLDVRHVTLSTGALTLAGCALGREAATMREYAAAAIGIAIIGSLNFGVSFILALAVALRARQVERSDRLKLTLSVFVTALRSPVQFFFPPRADRAPAVHGPVSVRPPRVH